MQISSVELVCVRGLRLFVVAIIDGDGKWLWMPLWKYPVVVSAWIYKPGWPNLQPVYGKPVDLLFYLIHSDFHREEEAVWSQYLLDVLIWPDSTKLFSSSWLALCVFGSAVFLLCFKCTRKEKKCFLSTFSHSLCHTCYAWLLTTCHFYVTAS